MSGFFAFLRALAVAAIALPAAALAQSSVTTAFVNVNVVAMDKPQVDVGQTVIVQNGRITAVGPAAQVAVPAGSMKIEGAGQFLIPGLAEMHGHNPPPGSSEDAVARTYFLYVANGVTVVRSMLGWDGQLELREKVRSGALLGPTLYLAGPSFNGQTVTSPAQAIQRVRDQKKQGWDLLKVHPGVPRDAYDAMAQTAAEVDIDFAGHVPADVGLIHALTKRQRTIDHLDGYIEHLGATTEAIDAAKLQDLVSRTREQGVAVVPTMVLWDTIIGAHALSTLMEFDELKYMPAQDVAAWRASYEKRIAAPGFDATAARATAANRRKVLKALSDGGVEVLFGTDSPQQFSVPGFSIHREMQAMHAAGMSSYDILRSATRNVAEHMGEAGQFGVVAPGARADLVLLKGNPLEDIGHVARQAGVMVRGQWLSEQEIEKRLDQIAAGLRK